jgi:hypothetical protein
MKTQLPKISSYGQYSSDNYGAHCLKVVIGDLELWFSYSTVVAFSVPSCGQIVHKNDWGTTTGKHLRWIDGQTSKTAKHRKTAKEFESLWAKHVEPMFTQNNILGDLGNLLPKAV